MLPLACHMHLAEPGYLCTKQALWAVQAWTVPRARQGTRWRTGHFSQQLMWGPKLPPGPLPYHWEKALNLHPSKCKIPNHSWVDWWEAEEEKLDGERSLPEWGLNSRPMSFNATTTPHSLALTHTHTQQQQQLLLLLQKKKKTKISCILIFLQDLWMKALKREKSRKSNLACLKAASIQLQ